MAAKKHNEPHEANLEGQERIAELEQGGTDGPHGPHSGSRADKREHDPQARVVSGDSGNWHETDESGNDDEQTERTAQVDKNKVGSKHGFEMSGERDHTTGGDSYEHTGSENREGMGSGSEAGPAHQGHSKPGRRHGKE